MNRNDLTPLQRELFDLYSPEIGKYVDEEDMVADIKRMNAAELRHHIKVLKECT